MKSSIEGSNSSLNTTSSKRDNVKVSVRLRPLQEIELNLNAGKSDIFCTESGALGKVKCASNEFCYDFVFDENTANQTVYENAASSLVESFLEGYNGVVFAYGQTNSGKTYTMSGNSVNLGVIPLSIQQIFKHIQNSPHRIFLIRISFLEIYNENIIDLLSPETIDLKIHETPQKKVYVSNLKEEIISSYDQMFDIIRTGEQNRHVFSTDYNLHSSRSHSILQVTIESSEIESGIQQPQTRHPGAKKSLVGLSKKTRVSTLSLIDLAGSEKASSSLDRRREGAYINKSLLTLGTVISKLTAPGTSKDTHIPYRDSKLTRILQPALSGNSLISVICTISPSNLNIEESLNTLKFAHRIKEVKTNVTSTEIMDERALLQQYKSEIDDLKLKLTELSSKENDSQELAKEKKRLEDELQQQQMVRTALKERIDHLTRLILSSSSLQNEQYLMKKVPVSNDAEAFDWKKIADEKSEIISKQEEEISNLKSLLKESRDALIELKKEKEKNEILSQHMESLKNRYSMRSETPFVNLDDLKGMSLTDEQVQLDPDKFVEMEHQLTELRLEVNDLQTDKEKLLKMINVLKSKLLKQGETSSLNDLETGRKRSMGTAKEDFGTPAKKQVEPIKTNSVATPSASLPTPPLTKTESLLKELEYNLDKEKKLRSKTIDRLATLETELVLSRTEMSVRSSMEELDGALMELTDSRRPSAASKNNSRKGSRVNLNDF